MGDPRRALPQRPEVHCGPRGVFTWGLEAPFSRIGNSLGVPRTFHSGSFGITSLRFNPEYDLVFRGDLRPQVDPRDLIGVVLHE